MRLLISLVGVILVFGGMGCVPKSRRDHTSEILLPGQTGSNFRRRILLDDGRAMEPAKRGDPKPGELKPIAKERKAPKKERKPATRLDEEVSAPDRFR